MDTTPNEGAASPASRDLKRERIAVLLNMKAKRVTPKLVQKARQMLPDCEIFCTENFEEARKAAKRIIDEDFDTVFTGGGDGTFFGTLHEILKLEAARKEDGQPAKMPRFGILKLGTGNALASLLHSSGGSGLWKDIQRTRDGLAPASLPMRLVQTDDGIRVPFAGVGLDAGILNYYIQVKNAFSNTALRSISAGAMGYFSAILFKAVPYYLIRGNTTNVEVIARAPAWKFGEADVLEKTPVPAGTSLYKGSVLLAAAGTSPYYGYKFTMFPLWNVNPDLMHLRIVTISPATLVANLRSVWKGIYRSPLVHEYLCSDIEVRALNSPIPYQLGGDAGGYRESVRWTISKEQFRLVDFTPEK